MGVQTALRALLLLLLSWCISQSPLLPLLLQHIMRIPNVALAALLTIAVILIGLCHACSSPAQMKSNIDALLANSSFGLFRTTPGVYVQQLNITTRTWKDLYTLRHLEYHTPASNNKVLTTAAVITALGPNHVMHTPILGTGQTPNEPLLCIKGSGDPSMTFAKLQAAAKSLAQRGVSSVSSLVLDNSLYDPSFPLGWQWEDLPYYYGAQPSSFILQENVMDIQVSPGNNVGDPLVITYTNPTDRSLGLVRTSLSTTSAAGTPSTVDVSWRVGLPNIFVIGSMPLGSSPTTIPAAVINPTERFSAMLVTALQGAGITINSVSIGSCQQPNNPPVTELIRIDSDSLGSMVNHTLQVSDNLMAEIWSRYLGAIYGGPGDATNRGLSAVSSILSGKLGVPASSFRQRDGSGLDYGNLVSPQALIATVKHMGEGPYAAAYKSYLPNSYPGGALYSRFRGTPAVGRVFAKTGYVSVVSSLSGWVDSDKLFSILLDQSPVAASTRKRVIDQIVLYIADLCPMQ